MNNYRFVLDQSTSGTKLLVIHGEQIVKRYDKAHKQIFPNPDWVEQDPEEIWQNVESLLEQALSENELTTEQVASLSITNQRETIVIWDKTTGKPLYNAIVWQCRRSDKRCEKLLQEDKAPLINQKTGLRIDPYFSGTKIQWLYDEVREVQKKSVAGELAIGTMDSWLIWNLTQGKVFATEASNASRTLLFNIQKLAWDEELLALFHCQMSDLPELRKSSANFGDYKGIPIQGVMADSQAALVGQGCLMSGEVKITLGTGSSVLMQINDQGDFRDERIMTTIASASEGKTCYALEGIIRSCADSIHWFQENIASFSDINQACNQVLTECSQNAVFFVPALQGLAAPFWSNEASGMFLGMSRQTTKEDMLRAILESIVFQVKAVIEVMEEVTQQKIATVKVDGGVTRNTQLMKMLADLLEKKIIINNVEELSALGALAIFTDNERKICLNQQTIFPQPNQSLSNQYQEWQKRVAWSQNY